MDLYILLLQGAHAGRDTSADPLTGATGHSLHAWLCVNYN